MSCSLFEKSDFCSDCADPRCVVKGGETDPHDMCGCEACEWHSMVGDRPVCINGEFVESAQLKP